MPTPPELNKPLPRPGVTIAEAVDVETNEKAPPRQAPVDDRHVKFAEETHNYIREFIRNADQKATFIFAVLTALLAFLNTQNVPSRWLKDPRRWSFIDALGFLGMVGLATGACILLGVIFPRMPGSRRGILYFNAIAEYENSTEYANDILARPGDYLARAKLQHCYDLATICKNKYRWLCWGSIVGIVGAGISILFLLIAKSTP